MDYISIVS